MSEAKGKWVKEESVGQGSAGAWWSVCEAQGRPCLGLSPVGHQHLDDEIGEEDQEGAGRIVFEGGEGRKSILEGQGSVWPQGPPGLPITLEESVPGKERETQPHRPAVQFSLR